MSKKKSGPRQARPIKQVRSDLAKLKRVGLYSGDVRTAKGGWRQIKLLNQFADVLSGKAKVVKVGREAKSFDPSYRPRLGKVVVTAQKNERLRYDPKKKRITSKREEYGVKYTRIITTNRITSPQDLPNNPRPGFKFLYKLPHNPLRDYSGTVDLLNKYKGKRGFLDALEVYEIDEAYFPDDEEDAA